MESRSSERPELPARASGDGDVSCGPFTCAIDWLSARPMATVVLAGLITLAITAAESAAYLPLPLCHDEFSYLLAADTFARGRLTNPTHPLWEHFETFHVIHQPTYTSKFPPMQGIFLACGQLLGHPIIGVLIAASLAAGATCWMAFGWLPPRWATLTGLLIATNPLLLTGWGQSYWGGSVTMLGGSLLYGALPRLLLRPQVRLAAVMVVALVLLANSRPYEGAVASMPVACSLLAACWRRSGRARRQLLVRGFVPLVIGGAALAAQLMVYNAVVTGSPLRMPYQVHVQTYDVCPLFVFQPLHPEPEYRHAVIRRFHVVDSVDQFWRKQRTVSDWARFKALDLLSIAWQFFGPGLLVFAVALPATWFRGSFRFLFGACLWSVSCSLAGTFLQSHYLAAILPAMLVLVVGSAAQMYRWGSVSKLVVIAALAWHFYHSATAVEHLVRGSMRTPPAAHRAQEWAWHRERIRRELLDQPGNHVAVVRYGRRHAASPAEWIYNGAEIDSQRIVWAREMGPDENRRLIDYYSNRRIWLVLADEQPPKLIEHRRTERD